MRTAFLVDDNGTYKALVGDDVVSSAASAYALGIADPALLAQIAAHTLFRGAKAVDAGAGARVDTDARGAVALTFFWADGIEATTVLRPAHG